MLGLKTKHLYELTNSPLPHHTMKYHAILTSSFVRLWQWDCSPAGSESDETSSAVEGAGKMIRCLRSSEPDDWNDEPMK
jgi:hypothetical protein